MPPINRIGALILAAGGSTRMGRPKQLLTFAGKTLLRRAAESALAAELSPIVVVLGDDPQATMAAEVSNLLVRIVHNPAWPAGMGTSIRAGMKSLAEFGNLRGVVVTLCDQPLVTGPALRRIIETFSRIASGVVASTYSDTLGVPAAFGPECFPELAALKDDHGAKPILLAHANTMRKVPMPEAALDIDDPTTYARLLNLDRGGC